MTAVALAYQVQCRMTGAAPIMQREFDHTTQLSYSVAAGVSKALGLTVEQAANAIAICGAEHNALAVIRAVPIRSGKAWPRPRQRWAASTRRSWPGGA